MTKTVVQLPRSIAPIPKHQMVRVGSRYDGGYVIAAPVLDNTEYVLTFGLGLNWDFERELARIRHVERIHCYDHTITKRYLLNRYVKAKILYKIKPLKYGSQIRACENYKYFFQTNPDFKHFELCVAATDGPARISMNSTIDQLAAASDRSFFKCDIEGAEYEISSSIIESAVKFQGIALEFHDVSARLDEVISIITALSTTHNLDHIHANNMSKIDQHGIPSVIEVSMSRHDLKTRFNSAIINRFGLPNSNDPIVLDQPNAPDRPDMIINFF